MKRSIFAAAAVLLISTAAAQALELSCNAPRVTLGDERDDNPVVGVEIKYKAEDHAWRIFHRLRNGLVVARAEQYAIQDWTNDRKTQWQGSLNRNRRLMMIGEVRQSANGVQYHESMYDRGKGGALVMQMTAQCTMPLPTPTVSAPAPSLPAPTASAPVADSVPIFPANNGTSAMKPAEANPASETLEQATVGYTFDGKCRGFPQKEQVGLLAGPQQEIEKIVEGEGYAGCKLIAGSSAEAKILEECSSGSPCEINAKLRVDKNHDVEAIDAQSVKSWESWKGTCYGKVNHEGDGYFTAGVVDVQIPNKFKMPVRCTFYEASVAEKILAACPQDSICEIRARFEKRPEVSFSSDQQTYATIGLVDSVKMKEPPSNSKDSDSQTYSDSKLETCSTAINDPLRPMIIDRLVSGGKHISPNWTTTIKGDLERDYGSYLKVRNDATVEKTDERTGKVGCAVTFEADLQGLSKTVLDEGATARAQILIRQIAREGKYISRRLKYTVQKTSGGSLIVWFGLTADSPAPAQRQAVRCFLAFGGHCAVWAR